MPPQNALFTLSNRFGGLNSHDEPHLIGPSRAVALSNVSLDSNAIQAQAGPGTAAFTGTAGTYRSLYKFGANWVTNLNTVAWQYVEFDGKVIRAAAGQTPQRSADGLTWYNLGIAAPGSAPTTAAGAGGNPSGTYYYVVTNVSTLGGESAPGPASAGVVVAAQKVSLTNIPVSADAQVTARKLYRIGGGNTSYKLVATLNASDTTYTDDTANGNEGAEITTSDYDVPGNLEGICVAPHTSRLFGWIGNTLYWSEKSVPSAWTGDFQGTPDDIKAVLAYAGSVVVLTTSQPILVLGNDVDGTTLQWPLYAVPAQQGCLERDTAVDMGHSIFYLSNDGICRFAGREVEVISKGALADSLLGEPGAASPTNAKAVRYDERYIIFFQSGTSFPSGGYVEWNPRVDGNWLMGTITATATHYNRTADVLYVAQGANIAYPWEGGATVAGSYTTGAWIDKTYSLLKHWRKVAVDHTGPITLDVIVDGTTWLSAAALTQAATVARSLSRLPAGCKGRAIQIRVNWGAAPANPVKVVELLDDIARKAARL
jgi:hypothetical protein